MGFPILEELLSMQLCMKWGPGESWKLSWTLHCPIMPHVSYLRSSLNGSELAWLVRTASSRRDSRRDGMMSETFFLISSSVMSIRFTKKSPCSSRKYLLMELWEKIILSVLLGATEVFRLENVEMITLYSYIHHYVFVLGLSVCAEIWILKRLTRVDQTPLRWLAIMGVNILDRQCNKKKPEHWRNH